jgi:hypothetical protein
MDDLAQLYADWCAARGTDAESERLAREAYEQALRVGASPDPA